MLMALETDMPRVSRTLSACSLTSGSIRAYKFAVLFISINIYICTHKCNTFLKFHQIKAKTLLFSRYEFINPLMNFSASATFAPFLISEMASESFA